MTAASAGRSTRRWKRLCVELRATLPPLCGICGQIIDLDLPPRHPQSWTLDHIIPRSVRPDLAEDPDNLRPAHYGCNSARGAAGHEKRPGHLRVSRRWG
ncbi:HNH endonuclease [Streptomyces sp. CC53]|uniref:HNH endonuclease n=1 Tax=Streptomyces sp. CC53 TaxID=1906740 RepID=UPI0009A11B96